MKIAIFGSTGFVGKVLVEKALEQGHEIKTLVRDMNKLGELKDKVEVIQGDLFSSLRQDAFFDLILFNAPYLPVTEEEPRSWIDYAWSGGLTGREIIDRFITQVSDHLKPNGRVLLVQSTLSDVEQTLKEFHQRGFKATIVGEQKAAFETITLIQAKLNDPHTRQP